MNLFKTAKRNQDAITDDQRPAIVILDADEAADDGDPPNRPAGAPRRIGLTPEIYILLSESAADLGPALNALRAAVIAAVMSDAQLIALVLQREGIRYEGCATALARGRKMEGELGLAFTFTYLLNPATVATTDTRELILARLLAICEGLQA